MSPKLRSIDEQVIVITVASSGIGLATAQFAAQPNPRGKDRSPEIAFCDQTHAARRESKFG